jgi:lipoyl(octanoyl) transferase
MIAIHRETILDWPYDEALRWMSEAHAKLNEHKDQVYLAVGSHQETVITTGRNQSKAVIEKELLSAWPELLLRTTERGGGLTAHEPGQLVLYPVLSLFEQNLSVPLWVSLLENTMLKFVKSLGLNGEKRPQGPGIYINDAKVGFVGVRLHQGISTHGIAINVKNSGKIFQSFAPCGIAGLSVASIKDFCQLPEPLLHYATSLSDIFVELLIEREFH